MDDTQPVRMRKALKIPKAKRSLKHTSNTSIIFSAFLHALILFAILSMLFLLVISVLETKAFKSEINKNLDKTLPQALQDHNDGGVLKQTLKDLPLDKMEKLYDQPSDAVKIYNSWLKTTMIICIVAGLIGMIISSLFLYFTCNKRIPFWFIVAENIAIFTAVGIFEAYFFLKIGFKYIPVPPSLLIERLYADLKKW
jgi:hypothetical protein